MVLWNCARQFYISVFWYLGVADTRKFRNSLLHLNTFPKHCLLYGAQGDFLHKSLNMLLLVYSTRQVNQISKITNINAIKYATVS